MRFFLFLIVGLYSLSSMSQVDSTRLKKYTPGFRFNEGIYLNHDQLLQNEPIPKNRIISNFNPADFDFFDKLLSEKNIMYYDQFGLKKEVAVKDLWGFCRRGSIYVNWGNDFCRIPVVGSVCHFVATITVYDNQGYNYMYGNSYYYAPSVNSHTEVLQFIMDYETGRIMNYTEENVKVILMKDPELYDEYNSLKAKKQKDLKFLYLRKFNEKYPLYVPIR